VFYVSQCFQSLHAYQLEAYPDTDPGDVAHVGSTHVRTHTHIISQRVHVQSCVYMHKNCLYTFVCMYTFSSTGYTHTISIAYEKLSIYSKKLGGAKKRVASVTKPSCTNFETERAKDLDMYTKKSPKSTSKNPRHTQNSPRYAAQDPLKRTPRTLYTALNTLQEN